MTMSSHRVHSYGIVYTIVSAETGEGARCVHALSYLRNSSASVSFYLCTGTLGAERLYAQRNIMRLLENVLNVRSPGTKGRLHLVTVCLLNANSSDIVQIIVTELA